MPTIIINGDRVECRPGVNVLQAALEAGVNVPHYCYHPALSVVASCRLCLMEMKALNPKTKQLDWLPRLVPSCQTPVRDHPDGSPMEVRFDSPAVQNSQAHVMEYLLINHPLDCPVCDQAGECYLQDYSQKFGKATSRMVEEKVKNPKKDIGSRTLLYQDRCVMCTRCVRFAREISGTGELCVVNRGDHTEIDVFPGLPLENPLQGNVADICPVGCLLDKDFLFRQRVWLLHETPGITIADASGANIAIHHNEGRVYRIKPRYNPRTNGFWISDEQRFSYRHIHDEKRLQGHAWRRERGHEAEPVGGEKAGKILLERLKEAGPDRSADAGRKGETGRCCAILSPFLSNEEAWLTASLVRQADPLATLGLGFVPREGEDQLFPAGTTEAPKAKFIIRGEKCPNRQGVEAVLNHLAGPRLDYGTDGQAIFNALKVGRIQFLWITGGEPRVEAAWRTDLARVLGELDGGVHNPVSKNRPVMVVVQDLFHTPLTEQADLILASASFAERAGSFTNCDGLTQRFEAAIDPVGDFHPDGEWLWTLTKHVGLFDPETVLEEMTAAGLSFERCEAPEVPEHAH